MIGVVFGEGITVATKGACPRFRSEIDRREAIQNGTAFTQQRLVFYQHQVLNILHWI